VRVLLLSQYFAPEVTAASFRLEPLARFLAAAGHDVDVVCEVPNHPDGIVAPGWSGVRPVQTRRVDGYRVRHLWVPASPAKGFAARAASYGSYAAGAVVAGVARRRPNVILASSPPMPVAAAGMAVARLRRVPWVMDVRDPWPEAAVGLGELTNPRVIGALEKLELRLYADAAAIVTVTEPFRRDIGAKAGGTGKVSVIANGTTDEWLAVGLAEVPRAELEMPADRFVVTYAGNVGLAQGLETAIEAAAELDDGFQLQIVGSGPRLAALREQAASLPPGRVAFRSLVEPPVAARLLRASDAALVSLGANRERARSVPVKLYDSCAVARPVVLVGEGEARRQAEEAGAALSVDSGDAAGLATAIRRLRDDAETATRIAAAARRFAEANRREDGLARFEAVLREAAGEARDG
jgi:glycosyltransferase involved in cell wall biosynthesis